MAKKSLKADADAALVAYDKMEGYRIQEELLTLLMQKYPHHNNKMGVETKVKLLNLFYSTGIQATSAMANHICEEIKDIDKRLGRGDLSLVEEIATLNLKNETTRFNYSFATKYCAYHKPKKYPIYDSIVANTFTSLFEKGLLPKYNLGKRNLESSNIYTKSGFEKKLKNYEFFVKLYKYFMELYDLNGFSFREVDSYIWGAFKIADEDFEIEKMAQLDKSKIIEVKINRNK